MKVSIVLGLLSVSISALAVQKRQFPVDFLGMTMKKEKAFKIESKASKIYPGAKQMRILYGPYKINAANKKEFKGTGFSMDPHGTGYMSQVDSDFPTDITVLRTLSYAVDENFKQTDTADGLYNHHDVFFDMGKTPKSYIGCNGKTVPTSPVNILMGGATETTPSVYYRNSSGVNSGYYVAPKSKIAVMLDMVNYKDIPRTVYIEALIDYLPGKQEGWLESQTGIINLGMCDAGTGTGFRANNVHAPAGVSKFNLKAEKPVEIVRDGYIVAANGHLHDGGLQMDIIINGKLACVSTARYGGPGHTALGPDGKEWTTIAETTLCPEAIKVSKGDKVMLEAKFDFDQHPARQSAHGEEAEGMALVGVIFAS